MRLSIVISFVLALILAGLAVVGARNWLALERQQITDSIPAFTRDDDGKPKHTIVVAAEQISFGERLIPNKLREIEWASDVLPQGSFTTVGDLVIDDSEENARFALTTMSVGEPILSNKVTIPGQRAKLSTALTPGMKAVSIRVNDVLGVAGFVLPGDRVDILLTRGKAGESFVDVLLQGVKVLAIDQIADDRKDQPSVVRTVTFEVNTEEAQKLVLAANVGTLSLALRNVASNDVEQTDRMTLVELSDADVSEALARENLQRIREEAEKAKEEASLAREELLKMQAEADKAAEEARLAVGQSVDEASQQRLDELETLLKNISEGISVRLEGVEEKIQSQEPVIVEKEVVVERVVEKPVVVSPPKKSTIGVIRNGNRAEYKVGRAEADEFSQGSAEAKQ
ncbi:Flp pilus assembly protein CpaB [Thalassovita aquimarina]|uniref:Flp pilus assembly protein CpaB n=1 Tax=Thalassovita aquimarina TaxID=2785917 RepID=A0ABS5HN50_9RHOB|nr:Flp pilus assembly protein CpaB [Thalassovita aquimarina]MBR9650365.1 Flp pilus assembly protein CpaB [Thalassovita aquimarina]